MNAVSITPAGNVGIGTGNPNGKLELLSESNADQLILSRNTIVGGEGPGIVFKNIVNSGIIENIAGIESQLKSGSTGAVAGSLNFFTVRNSIKVNALSVTPDGEVGIGTTNTQGFKLAVNGNIRTKEIKVESDNWPDYVFHPLYPLPSLAEVKKIISTNQHLSDIPSASHVNANGIDLGAINRALVKKVEELTLYLIRQDEALKRLEKTAQSERKNNQVQQEQIENLKTQLDLLIKKIR